VLEQLPSAWQPSRGRWELTLDLEAFSTPSSGFLSDPGRLARRGASERVGFCLPTLSAVVLGLFPDRAVAAGTGRGAACLKLWDS